MQSRLHIYNSLILSYINFGILAWGYQCERIIKLQKKAIRIVNLSKYNAHCEPILKELNLLKVTDILDLQVLKFFYKFKNQMLPNYFQNMPFTTNVHQHGHHTRQIHKIHQPFAGHDFAKRCLRFYLPRIINNSPDFILDKVDTHSLQGYSLYIKKYMLKNYQGTCTIVNCYVCSKT